MKYNITMANSGMKSLQVAEAAGMKGLLNPLQKEGNENSMKKQKKETITRKDLNKMSQLNPLKVDKDNLVDIADININQDLNKEERVLDFVRQIKNPYCYLDHDIVVKISFSGKRSLQSCIIENLI